MKAFIYCVLFAIFGVAELCAAELDEVFEEHAPVCLKENNLDISIVEGLKEKELNPDDITHDMKCALLCMLEKGGLMDKDGNVIAESAKEYVPADKLADFYKANEECSKLSGSDPCETALLRTACMFEHHKKNA